MAGGGAASRAVRPGRRVRNEQFGEGGVTSCEERGEHARVKVNVTGAGSKWLVLAYAKLQQLSGPAPALMAGRGATRAGLARKCPDGALYLS